MEKLRAQHSTTQQSRSTRDPGWYKCPAWLCSARTVVLLWCIRSTGGIACLLYLPT